MSNFVHQTQNALLFVFLTWMHCKMLRHGLNGSILLHILDMYTRQIYLQIIILHAVYHTRWSFNSKLQRTCASVRSVPSDTAFTAAAPWVSDVTDDFLAHPFSRSSKKKVLKFENINPGSGPTHTAAPALTRLNTYLCKEDIVFKHCNRHAMDSSALGASAFNNINATPQACLERQVRFYQFLKEYTTSESPVDADVSSQMSNPAGMWSFSLHFRLRCEDGCPSRPFVLFTRHYCASNCFPF